MDVMKKKIIQSVIVLIGLLVLARTAFTVRTIPGKPANQSDTKPAQTDTGEPQEPEPASVEEHLLSLVNPEAYRTAEDLNVEKGTYISVILREDRSEFAHSFKDGVNQACADLNEWLEYKGADKVRVNCNAPAEAESITSQSNLLDEELALYPDVVAVSIVDAQACEVQFDLAIENGIYIIGFDSIPAYDSVAARIETDNEAAVQETADKLAAALQQKEPGTILIVSQDGTSDNLKSRRDVFTQYMADHYPDYPCEATYQMTSLKEIAEQLAAGYAEDEDTENDIEAADVKQEDVLRYLFAQYPNVKGVFATDEKSAELVLEYLSNEPEAPDVTVAAFGSPKVLQEYADKGILCSYIEENGYGMGYATAVAAFRISCEKGNVDQITVGHTSWPETVVSGN